MKARMQFSLRTALIATLCIAVFGVATTTLIHWYKARQQKFVQDAVKAYQTRLAEDQRVLHEKIGPGNLGGPGANFAAVTLEEDLLLEDKDWYADEKQSLDEQRAAMVARFESYTSNAATDAQKELIAKAFKAANERIVERGRKAVKGADDGPEKVKENASGSAVKI